MTYDRIFLSVVYAVYLASSIAIMKRVRRRGHDPRGGGRNEALARKVAVATVAWQALVLLAIAGVDRIVWWGRIDALHRPWIQVMGGIVFSAGLLLAISGALTLGDSFRLGLPKEDTPLVTHGIYRYSRNPVILGLYGYVFGFFLIIPSAAVLLNLALNFGAYHLKVLSEERYLRSAHGDEYEKYCARTGRYF